MNFYNTLIRNQDIIKKVVFEYINNYEVRAGSGYPMFYCSMEEVHQLVKRALERFDMCEMNFDINEQGA